MAFDADGWAKIISTIFSGVKECILAVAAVATIWYQAQNSGKLDAQSIKLDNAAEKASIAADKTEEVQKTLAVTTIDRDKQINGMRAEVAAVKAELTKDPDDMDRAKAAKSRMDDGLEPLK